MNLALKLDKAWDQAVHRSAAAAYRLSGRRIRAPRLVGRVLNLQQFWCWGQDVRWTENLLMRYGFEKSGHGQEWPTRYTLTEPDRTIRLWSYGLHYGTEAGSVLLHRQGFDPRFDAGRRDPPEAVLWPWDLDAHLAPLPPLADEHRPLVADALQWIADYEDWVHEVAGPGYRQKCLQIWHEASVVNHRDMAQAWRRMARHVDGISDRADSGDPAPRSGASGASPQHARSPVAERLSHSMHAACKPGK